MSKCFEKLRLLNELGVGIIHRVYAVKRTFQSEERRPKFLGELGFQKITQALTKSFPEVKIIYLFYFKKFLFNSFKTSAPRPLYTPNYPTPTHHPHH